MVIKLIRYGWIEEINHIYPALADYMKKYVFSTTVLQQELTLNWLQKEQVSPICLAT